MLKKCVLLFLMLGLLLPLSAWGTPKKKKYPIRWRYDKGLYNIQLLKVEIKIKRYLLKEDGKTPQKQVADTKVNLECLIDWRVTDVNEQGQAVIALFHRKGKIKLERDDEKYNCEVENPDHARMLENPALSSYIRNVSGGVVFVFDTKQEKILTTWDLEPVSIENKAEGEEGDVVQYKKTMKPGDPYNMEDSFKQLPGKEVPLGEKWQRTRRRGGLIYTYNYHFTEVVKFKDSDIEVAVIKINGNIKKGAEEVGTVEGEYQHNCETDTMFYQKVTEKMKNITPADNQPDNGKVGGVLEEMERTVEIEILQSNATFIEKRVK